jgi:hypothetical protein
MQPPPEPRLIRVAPSARLVGGNKWRLARPGMTVDDLLALGLKERIIRYWARTGRAEFTESVSITKAEQRRLREEKRRGPREKPRSLPARPAREKPRAAPKPRPLLPPPVARRAPPPSGLKTCARCDHPFWAHSDAKGAELCPCCRPR